MLECIRSRARHAEQADSGAGPEIAGDRRDTDVRVSGPQRHAVAGGPTDGGEPADQHRQTPAKREQDHRGAAGGGVCIVELAAEHWPVDVCRGDATRLCDLEQRGGLQRGGIEQARPSGPAVIAAPVVDAMLCWRLPGRQRGPGWWREGWLRQQGARRALTQEASEARQRCPRHHLSKELEVRRVQAQENDPVPVARERQRRRHRGDDGQSDQRHAAVVANPGSPGPQASDDRRYREACRERQEDHDEADDPAGRGRQAVPASGQELPCQCAREQRQGRRSRQFRTPGGSGSSGSARESSQGGGSQERCPEPLPQADGRQQPRAQGHQQERRSADQREGVESSRHGASQGAMEPPGECAAEHWREPAAALLLARAPESRLPTVDAHPGILTSSGRPGIIACPPDLD